MPDLDVRLSPRFLACLKNLSETEIRRVEKALGGIAKSFGRPHVHSGISIRRLYEDIFECRAGIELRLLFRARRDALEIFFVGDHDAVRKLIRDLT